MAAQVQLEDGTWGPYEDEVPYLELCGFAVNKCSQAVPKKSRLVFPGDHLLEGPIRYTSWCQTQKMVYLFEQPAESPES